MNFELTKEFLDELRGAIKLGNQSFIQEKISTLHPADLAEILDQLDSEESIQFYQFLDKEIAGDVLVEMEEDVREKFLTQFTSKEIAQDFIENMESDDAADIISELPDSVKDEVISHIEDAEQASDIVDLLNYDEDTAGGLMAKELIAVNINWSVQKCIKEVRKQAEEIEDVYTTYVIDDRGKLLGLLSLKKLLLTPEEAKVSGIYKKDIVFVEASTSSEEVSNIMEKYDLVVVPVVDKLGRLLGRITIDDVVDVIKEEAEKDFQLASGISEKVEHSDSVWILSRSRLPWLLIGLLGGILGSRIIGNYESEIQIYPEMALFIPLIAAMGGNAGVQSSAIVVQGLANNSLGFTGILPKLFKELLVGLVNGIVCSTIIFTYNFFLNDSFQLGLTVGIALISVIVFATILGTFVPLVLDKYDINPALATGPFITTMNDVSGLFIYFLAGHLLYIPH
ncbi:MAG: magnesium transporter [Flavobacteriales bacterium]|nr:magnesium transporter [Flavobacteriales bacterium]